MNNITIKNNVSLARDLTSGAVINTNDSLYQKRLNEIKSLEQQKIKDDQFDSEFNALKTDVNEIKTLLKTLLASKE
jgi:hypothetical protein